MSLLAMVHRARRRSAAAVKVALRIFHERVIKANCSEGVARAYSALAHRAWSRRMGADLLTALVTTELDTGRVSSELGDAMAAQLSFAASHHRDGDVSKAVRGLNKAFALAFHRVLHFDRLASPLAADPEGFLAPMHENSAVRALTSGARALPVDPAPAARPVRLLIATRANDNFLAQIRQRYDDATGVDVRYLDLAADASHEKLLRRTDKLMEHLLGGSPAYGHEVERWLRPHIEWADTVFIDWCVSTAAMFTSLDPGRSRIIVRLHSFELFSRWPHLVSFGRVDDLVVVAKHMRDLARSVIPALSAETAPRLHVIPNAIDLASYVRSKSADARFTLGLVGIGSVAKDPRWAIEVLRLLREHDSRYRLLLIGGGPDPSTSASVANYHALLERDIAELEPSGAVHRTGPSNDIPSALTDVGVILSSSVRESFHVALVEGAASGAVPVVRDWPFFAGRANGARSLFPADWVVDTPAQAAERILSSTATESRWHEASDTASAHALSTWDWTITQHQFDRLILGSAAPAASV